MSGVLEGLRVLEWAEGVSGPFCGKILSDYGAEVVKLEVPGSGDPSRRWGPFRGDRPDPNASGLFLHLNTGKKSVLLDPNTTEGRNRFLALLRRCDVLVEDRGTARRAAAGLDLSTLRVENPRAVLTSVTPFGLDGPYRDYLADELILYHLGGYAFATPMQVEDPENHPPLRSGGMDAEVLGGLFGALGTLFALAGRDRDGVGRVVDACAFEGMAYFNRLNLVWLHYAHQLTSRLAGARQTGAPAGPLPCKDGYANIYCATDEHWRRLVKAMGNPDWADNELFATRAMRTEYWDDFKPLVCEWTSQFTKLELYELVQAAGVCCFPNLNMAEVLEYEQLTRRRYFQTVRHPVAGEVIHPGPAFQLPDAPAALRPAPLLGQHTEEVLSETEHPRLPSPPRREGPGKGVLPPLAGLRVLDLTWVIAGPTAAQLLGQMGADVIKVESSRSLDLSRMQGPYAEGEKHVEKSGYNHTYNCAKRSVAIDLTRPDGQRLLDDIAMRCDVVMEGMSLRAANKLGLHYERFRRLKPDVIYLSIAGLGRTEPHGGYVTYGPHLMAIGWNSLTGYPGDRPRQGGGQYTDQVSGIYTALAVLLALRHRQRTGRGQHVDLSMLECLLAALPNGILEYTMAGRILGFRGNSHPEHAPYGAYRCGGDDRWVAIAVRNDEEWRGLCEALGHPEWAEDSRFAIASERVNRRADVNRMVTEWTRERDPDEVMAALQGAGVPAGRTSNPADMAGDKQLAARHFFAQREHPVAGPRLLADVPFLIDGLRACNPTRAPLLGEHTDEVLSGLLGLSGDQIARLRASGVLT